MCARATLALGPCMHAKLIQWVYAGQVRAARIVARVSLGQHAGGQLQATTTSNQANQYLSSSLSILR